MRKALLLVLLAFMPQIGLSGTNFMKLSEGFTKNEGQMPGDVLFKAPAKNMDIYICSDGLLFEHKLISDTLIGGEASYYKKAHSYRMIFDHANIKPGNCKLQRKIPVSYIRAGRSIHSEKGDELIINGLYDNIDLRLYFENHCFRYDFIVKAGADPGKISFHFEGDDSSLAENNKIILGTSLGIIEHRDLKIYQNTGKQDDVAGSLIKSGKNFKYAINKYDPGRDLIIDPLVFSTFAGGSGRDELISSCRSANGNFFMTGSTMSDDFPATTGAYDGIFNGLMDVFVCKVSNDGSQLLYATYIGGDDSDVGMKIVADNNDEVFITGNTESINFPVTTGAFDTDANGDFDVFVCKLTADGSDLIYSSYLGGTYYEECKAIYLSGGGNVILGGKTYSENFPVTGGVYDETFNGVQDVFICKMNSTGRSLMYSTFVGGSELEYCYGMAVDPYENIYFTGATRSPDFPVSSGAWDMSFNGNWDVYICKLSDFGQTLERATYLGGGQYDVAYDITMDNNSDLIITGVTNSSDFDITADAFDNSQNGRMDIFISKFDSSLSSLLYSSYYGGAWDDEVNSINNDLQNCYYVTGVTSSDDFPTTVGAEDREFNGTADAFVTKIKTNGEPAYSTFLGGIASDEGVTAFALTCDEVIIAGNTFSDDFPVSDTGFDNEYNGESDVFLVKMSGFSRFFIEFEEISTTLCPGESFELDFLVSSTLNSGNFFSVELSGPDGSFKDPTVISSRYGTKSGKMNIHIPEDITEGDNYRIRMKATDPIILSDDNGFPIYIGTLPEPEISSGEFEVCKNSSAVYYARDNEKSYFRWEAEGGEIIGDNGKNNVEVMWGEAGPASLYLFEIFKESGCTDTLIRAIGLLDRPEPVLSGEVTTCSGSIETYSVNSENDITVQWFVTGGDIVDTIDQYNIEVLWKDAGEGEIKIIQSNRSCSDSAKFPVTIHSSPDAVIEGPAACVPGDTVSFTAVQGERYSYKWIASGSNISGPDNNKDIFVSWEKAGLYEVQLIVSDTETGCTDTNTVTITVLDEGGNTIFGDSTACQNDTLKYYVADNSDFLYEWKVTGGSIKGVNNKEEVIIIWNEAGLAELLLIRKVVLEDETIVPVDTSVMNLTIYPLPPKPVIILIDSLLESSADSGNQWYFNGKPVEGALEKQLLPAANGNYTVIVTDANGCSSVVSDAVQYDKLGIYEIVADFRMDIYPNPFTDFINIETDSDYYSFQIINILGNIVYSEKDFLRPRAYHLGLGFLRPGPYYVKFKKGPETIVVPIIKSNN